MKNLNKLIETGDFIADLFEKSDIAFCSNDIIGMIIKKHSRDISKKTIGMKLKKIGAVEKIIRSEGKLTRGWMVKYIGPMNL